MSKRRSTASIEREIAETKNQLKKVKARYDSLAEHLQNLDRQLELRRAEVLMAALSKSGKTMDDVLTFLRR